MGLMHKDLTKVTIVNSAVEAALASLDFDFYSRLTGDTLLGPNQAVRLTFYGSFEENSGGSRSVKFLFRFGSGGSDQDIDIPAGSTWWKAVYDVLLSGHPGGDLVGQTILVGDKTGSSGDERVNCSNGLGSMTSASMGFVLNAKLNAAHASLGVTLNGYYIETL